MTDKELLELAAKAAGVVYIEMDDLPHQDKCRYWNIGDSCDCGAEWNPLTDDGDALRLAVKLNMGIEVRADMAKVRAGSEYNNPAPCEFFDDDNDDPYAATRRAIVRAAAEIGKEMK